MAAPGNNGRPSFRSSRGPSLLVVGLAIAALVLFYGYWSVSSKNSQLLRDVNILQDRLRVLAAQKLAADRKNTALTSQMDEQSRTCRGNLEGERKAREDEKAEHKSRVDNLMRVAKDKEEKLDLLESQQGKHQKEIGDLRLFVTNSSKGLKLLQDKAAKVVTEYKALKEKHQETLSSVTKLEKEKDECQDALTKAKELAQKYSSSKKQSEDAVSKKEMDEEESKEDKKSMEVLPTSEEKGETKNEEEDSKDEEERHKQDEHESNEGKQDADSEHGAKASPRGVESTDEPSSLIKRNAEKEVKSESERASDSKQQANDPEDDREEQNDDEEKDTEKKSTDKENDNEQESELKIDSEGEEGNQRNDDSPFGSFKLPQGNARDQDDDDGERDRSVNSKLGSSSWREVF